MEHKEENFHEEIQKGLVLVDFYATWCGPCKMMHPVIEEIEKQYEDLKVIRIDVDQQEDLAREYKVMSIPTLFLFKDGKEVEKVIGFTPKQKLEEWIEKHQK